MYSADQIIIGSIKEIRVKYEHHAHMLVVSDDVVRVLAVTNNAVTSSFVPTSLRSQLIDGKYMQHG